MFLNDWKDSKLNGLTEDFRLKPSQLKGVKILLASYSYQDYSGDAFVLFKQGGKYYEVNGGHCSCYGLEDQWEPEEAVLQELWNRANVGRLGLDSYCGNEFNIEIKKIVSKLLKIKDKEGEK